VYSVLCFVILLFVLGDAVIVQMSPMGQ